MKTRLALALIVISLSAVFIVSFKTVNGTIMTFQLTPEAYQGVYTFEMQVGDRLEGSFTLSNLGPYRYLLNGQWVSYWINVWFSDPEGEVILNYTHTSGDSFNFTALDWGNYQLQVFCSGNAFFEGAKDPEMMINFEVIEAEMPQPPNPNILAWWKLTEGNGTAVYDSSWHNRQGTIHGATWINLDGNNFLDFNGESDYVSIPSLPLTDLDVLTVSAWINSDFAKNGQIVFHGDKGTFQLGNGDFVEGQNPSRYSNYGNFSVKLSDNNWYAVSSSYPMKPNAWHHLVGVWVNGTSLKIYVDGFLAGENDRIAPAGLFDSGGSFPSSLGVRAQANYAWDNPCFFKGQISNVMIYNKALNSQEVENLTTQIAELLSISKPSPPPTEPSKTPINLTPSPSVPEVPAWLILPFLMSGTVLGAILFRRRKAA